MEGSKREMAIYEEGYQLKKLQKKLIIIAIILITTLLAGLLLWNQGRQHGKAKADAEIQALKDELQMLRDENKALLDNPIVVNPVAPEITLDIINATIQGIGELATMEYLYTDAGQYSDSISVGNFNIPFTEKNFTIKWDGVIKAGIDVTKITTELKQEEKILVVYLPQAEILSHDPDKDSIEVLDEKDGLFNPVRVDDQVKFDAACEKAMEERAIENGLLEKAQENAKELILQLLNANPDINGNYTIEIKISHN